MRAPPDEYQNPTSPGSLVMARRYWSDLVSANALHLPQQFAFLYHSPTERTALGLAEFLKAPPDGEYESTTDRVAVSPGDPWRVAGTTYATVWSLASLEHLFMRMRRAGSRNESALADLDLLGLPRGLP